MIRVAVCDDHAMVREALANVMGNDPNIEAVGTTDSVASTLALLDAYAVDVLVLDVRLNGESGLELARRVVSTYPGVRIMVLTAFASEGLLVEAYELGASTFLLKSGDASGLVSAIRDVAVGRRLINPAEVRAASVAIERNGVGAIRKLDVNDRMIASLIAQGYSDKQIAESVFLGLQTVRNRVSRMLSRFDKQNRTQLALMFAEHELELAASAR
ncbi:MAG: response regulator [Ilumatobacteraceae bacterium]